jgi:hypothetical protein
MTSPNGGEATGVGRTAADYGADVPTEWDALRSENARLRQWVADLLSGEWLNCAHCGHRYGPWSTTTADIVAGALRAHVEQCPGHPMSPGSRPGSQPGKGWTAVACVDGTTVMGVD